LRHSFLTNCAAKGIDQRMIGERVGHQIEAMPAILNWAAEGLASRASAATLSGRNRGRCSPVRWRS
jgi:hypothetical protein